MPLSYQPPPPSGGDGRPDSGSTWDGSRPGSAGLGGSGWSQVRQAQFTGLPEEEAAAGVMIMSKRKPADLAGLMGKVWRSAVTGDVHLKASTVQQDNGDFCVVDLYTRDEVIGTPARLKEDKYLFKPVPLLYRTWIYHYLYNAGKVISQNGPEADGMVRHVLAYRCVDAPVSAGRWSPVMCLAPMSLGAAITADYVVVGLTTFLMVLTVFLSWSFNNPGMYRYGRLTSGFIRFGFSLFLLVMMFTSLANLDVAVFGYLISFACGFYDLVAGDGSMITTYWMHCSYEVVRALPNRIFVCKRLGAAGADFGSGETVERVDEVVTGLGRWDSNMVLIADLQGLLLELIPMQRHDWDSLLEESQSRGTKHFFMGIDVYNDEKRAAEPMLADEVEPAEAAVLLGKRGAMEGTKGPHPASERNAWVMENVG